MAIKIQEYTAKLLPEFSSCKFIHKEYRMFIRLDLVMIYFCAKC